MYFERLLTENVRHLPPSELVFSDGQEMVRRWTLLDSGPAATATMRCLAMASFGAWQISRVTNQIFPLLADIPSNPVRIEFVMVRHAPKDCASHDAPLGRRGWHLSPEGKSSLLKPQDTRFPAPDARWGISRTYRSQVGRLLLGYSDKVGVGDDGFEAIPDQRFRQCAGLFESESRVTDPLAFLQRLHHRRRYRSGGRADQLLHQMGDILRGWLGWDPSSTMNRIELEALWMSTPRTRRIPALVALDMIRQVFDVTALSGPPSPLKQPGVVLFDKVEVWCPRTQRPAFFRLLDALFPDLQFVLTLSPEGRKHFPLDLLQQGLPIPQPPPQPRPPARRRLPRGSVLLVDLDSQLPNLALMKLSRHFKGAGRVVRLRRGIKSLEPADTVMASCVFNTDRSMRHVEALRRHYGNSVQIGGSGVDLRLRLDAAIEAIPPDYSLYPELGDRALGFLTRGCPCHCPFCVVPIKEGSPRKVSGLDELLQGRKKLILLDDNLLAHPEALPMMEDMLRRGLAVNFNQTLDLRLVTHEAAALLRKINCSNVSFTRRNLYFSLNDARHLGLVRDRYALLQTRSQDNVAFVCMFGFNTTLAEDVARFRFLRSLPGAYVFVQRYRPTLGGAAPDYSILFDDQADTLLSELVRIVFPQNMKSMETYYRWLAIRYAAQRGRIHKDLLDALFRYNARERRGGFVARLEALCRDADSAKGGRDPLADTF